MTLSMVLFTALSAIVGLLVGAIINMLADDLPYSNIVRWAHYPDGTPRSGVLWLGMATFILGKRASVRRELHKRRLNPFKANPIKGKRKPLPHKYLRLHTQKHKAQSAVRRGLIRPETIAAGGRGTRNPTLSRGRLLSWRHPLTEIATALMFAYLAATYGIKPLTFFWMGNMAILFLITVIDLEHRLILFVIMIPACLYAIVEAAIIWPEISTVIKFQDYLIGGVAGFAIFGFMYIGGILFNAVVSSARGEPIDEVAFGYGDVMLATLSGLMLGWQALIFAIFITVFVGAAGAIVFLIGQRLVKGEYEVFTALPYGQYIVFGTIIMMLWREPVISYLQGMY